jgi:hypothetical protein
MLDFFICLFAFLLVIGLPILGEWLRRSSRRKIRRMNENLAAQHKLIMGKASDDAISYYDPTG